MSNQWSCNHCTFSENPIRYHVCEMCFNSRDDDDDVEMEREEEKEETWVCSNCTLINNCDHDTCETCEEPKPVVAVLDEYWQCKVCSLMNSASDSRCATCDSSTEAKTNQWQCVVCTRLNREISVCCETCDTIKCSAPEEEEEETPRYESLKTGSWICKQCTFVNAQTSEKCAICENINELIQSEKRSKAEFWTCGVCSFHNTNMNTNECDMCGSLQSAAGVVASVSTKRQASINDDDDDFQSLTPSLKRRAQESKKINKVYTENIDEAYTLVKKITQYCRKNKQKFVDDSFPPCDRSLFKTEARKEEVIGAKRVQWLHPEDIRVSREDERYEWSVFNGEPSFHDINQGHLGNCWFMSSLAVLVCEKPEIIKHIIVTEKYSAEGCYLVRLCHNGEWKVVLVDDLFPCDQNGYLLFSRARKRQLWVALIEKALAKLNGTYEALIAGHTTEGLVTLTGYPCETLRMHDEESDRELNWATLLSSKEAGFAIGASCYNKQLQESEYEKNGLASNHAYSVLDVKIVNNERLLQVRNPWGRKSWCGNWSNQSPFWTRQLREQFRSEYGRDPITGEEDNGTFWIAYNDFVKFYNSVDICKMRSDWMEARMSGFFVSEECRDILAFQLRVFETTEIEMTLVHKTDLSRLEQIEVDLMLLVFEYKQKSTLPYVTSSKRLLKRFINKEHIFRPGEYLIVPLSFNSWYTSTNSSFNLAIHSAKPFLLEQEIVPYYMLADSIISFARTVGKPYRTGDAIVYSVSDQFNGMLIVAENKDKKKYLRIEVDADDSTNIVSTRRSLITHDSIAPSHSQILLLLTQLESTQGYRVSYKYTTLVTREQNFDYAGETKIMNYPKLNRHVVALHSPRKIE